MSTSTKTILWIVVLIVIIGGGYVFYNSNKTPVAASDIKIGLSLPLTGDLAFIGEADRNAAQLALEEVKARTDLKNRYELVIEDDGFDAAKAASAVKKLITVDKVNALVSISSTAGNAAAPIAESYKIPHIGMASDATVAKGDYNFINWTRPQEEVSVMIAELQKRGIKNVAVIGLNQQGFLAIEKDFKEKAAPLGITITEEIFNSGTTDFRTIITKLQKTNPQIYLLGAFDPEIGIIAKQMQELGVKTPLTSIETFGLSADPKPFEGQWYVDAAVATKEFATKYQAKYGKAPGPAAANTYDAIHLFVTAFEEATKTGTPSALEVARALSAIKNYSGALGPLTIGPEGEFISQAAVKTIKNGQPADL